MDTANPTPKFSPEKYSAMSVWDLYSVMTTMMSLRNTLDLVCRAEQTGETAVFEWAEERQDDLDAELGAIATNLAGRLNLDRDDMDVRDMAFARVDGCVPSGMWHDGRLLRMRSAADLKKAGA